MMNYDKLNGIKALEKYLDEEIPNAVKNSNDTIKKCQDNIKIYQNIINKENKNIEILKNNMKKAKEVLENRKKVIEKHRNKTLDKIKGRLG